MDPKTLVNPKTMAVCSGIGLLSLVYWYGYFTGGIETRAIHAVLEILEHKDD